MIELRRFQGAGRACFAWLPPQAAQGPVAAVYCNGGDSLEEQLEEILEGLVPQMGTGLPPFALIGVAPTSWEQEFSPWPAPALGKKSPAFTGGCDAYLADLTGPILAQAEAQFPLSPRREDRMFGRVFPGRPGQPIRPVPDGGIWRGGQPVWLPVVPGLGGICPKPPAFGAGYPGLPLPGPGGGKEPPPVDAPGGGLYPVHRRDLDPSAQPAAPAGISSGRALYPGGPPVAAGPVCPDGGGIANAGR